MAKRRNQCDLPEVERSSSLVAKAAGQKLGYQIRTYGISDLWKQTQGEGVKVAILDTGCFKKHVDLKGSVFKSVRTNTSGLGRFTSGIKVNKKNIERLTRQLRRTKNQSRRKYIRKQIATYRRRLKAYQSRYANALLDVTDKDGHGTHVTGIVTANNNKLGVVGVAPQASVFVIKVLGDNGSGQYSDVARGIRQAVRAKVDVISMSLGGPDNDPALRAAVKMAYDAGIPVICAAGNSGNARKVDFPARYPQTISIGAVTDKRTRARFSQRGAHLDFMAPGVSILSTMPGNRYAVMSGTSMATPWVAGIVALMISKHRKYGGKTPIRNVEDVRSHLKKICVDMASRGKDSQTGFGLIDASQLKNDL